MLLLFVLFNLILLIKNQIQLKEGSLYIESSSNKTYSYFYMVNKTDTNDILASLNNIDLESYDLFFDIKNDSSLSFFPEKNDENNFKIISEYESQYIILSTQVIRNNCLFNKFCYLLITVKLKSSNLIQQTNDKINKFSLIITKPSIINTNSTVNLSINDILKDSPIQLFRIKIEDIRAYNSFELSISNSQLESTNELSLYISNDSNLLSKSSYNNYLSISNKSIILDIRELKFNIIKSMSYSILLISNKANNIELTNTLSVNTFSNLKINTSKYCLSEICYFYYDLNNKETNNNVNYIMNIENTNNDKGITNVYTTTTNSNSSNLTIKNSDNLTNLVAVNMVNNRYFKEFNTFKQLQTESLLVIKVMKNKENISRLTFSQNSSNEIIFNKRMIYSSQASENNVLKIFYTPTFINNSSETYMMINLININSTVSNLKVNYIVYNKQGLVVRASTPLISSNIIKLSDLKMINNNQYLFQFIPNSESANYSLELLINNNFLDFTQLTKGINRLIKKVDNTSFNMFYHINNTSLLNKINIETKIVDNCLVKTYGKFIYKSDSNLIIEESVNESNYMLNFTNQLELRNNTFKFSTESYLLLSSFITCDDQQEIESIDYQIAVNLYNSSNNNKIVNYLMQSNYMSDSAFSIDDYIAFNSNKNYTYTLFLDSCGFDVKYLFYKQNETTYDMIESTLEEVNSYFSNIEFSNDKGKYQLSFFSIKDFQGYIKFYNNTKTSNNVYEFYLRLNKTSSNTTLQNNNINLNSIDIINKNISFPIFNSVNKIYLYSSQTNDDTKYSNSLCFIRNNMSIYSETKVPTNSKIAYANFKDLTFSKTIILSAIGETISKEIFNYQPYIDLNANISFNNRYQDTPYFYSLFFTSLLIFVLVLIYAIANSCIVYKKDLFLLKVSDEKSSFLNN